MRKVERYICDICGTEYKDKTMCEKCEKTHKTELTIKQRRYLPITQGKTGLPVTITIEYKDGKYIREAVYKR